MVDVATFAGAASAASQNLEGTPPTPPAYTPPAPAPPAAAPALGLGLNMITMVVAGDLKVIAGAGMVVAKRS